MDYETEIIVDLFIDGKVKIYDRSKWIINRGRVEWVGGKNGEEVGRYLEDLVEDVFNAKATIGGRVRWEGEEEDDFGYYEVGEDVKCFFGKKINYYNYGK